MNREWYREDINKILKNFGTSIERGLTEIKFKDHLKKYGRNILVEEKTKTYFQIFIGQFKSPLIYVLLGAAIIVLLLGDYIDGGIILGIIILNSIIGTFQEGKAQNTLQALKRVVKSYASVIRNGKEERISDEELVPGDIILLKDGESIPADARIIKSNSLKLNESSLTGESTPVLKNSDQISATNLNTSDQINMVFRGTYVISGLGTAVIVETGINTVIGKISKKLSKIETEIPLQRNISNLSNIIVAIVLFVSTLIFIVGIYNDKSVFEMFITVVAVSVSAIPESLPVVVTLVLATGVWRMSKKNVLVKRLQAVEALGQANVIALDKTGTITKNQMTVEKIYVNERSFDVSGAGYDPDGEITENGKKIDPLKDKDLNMAIKTAVLTAIAEINYSNEKKEWILDFGDPTEAALLVLGRKAGIEKDNLLRENPQILEIPFDFEYKHHTTVNSVEGKKFLFTAGGPEMIIEKCSSIWSNQNSRKITEKDKAELEQVLHNFSKEGYRILALAINHNPPTKPTGKDIGHLTFVGFVAILDSIRPEVLSSVNAVRDAGMQVVMITGDHAITAKAIAEKVGIYYEGSKILAGHEMKEMSEDQLAGVLEQVSVFARVTPEDKLRIIEAYKKLGKTIAMTGDGINDALSLVSADLGVSMGKIGTEVAREASDIVLLDDKFGNIIEAAEEGRNIYWTIRKSILYLLSTNLAELLVIAIAVVIGLPLPLLATQIIWLNLVTDTFLVAAIAVDPKEKGLLRESFRRPSKFLIDWLMATRIILIGGLMTAITLFMFTQYIDADSMEKAWTISLTVLTVFQWYNIFNIRSHKDSIFSKTLFNNKYLIIGLFIAIGMHLFAIYVPFMQKILHTTGLNVMEWGIILLIGLSIIIVEEIRKIFYRKSIKSRQILAS